MLVPQGTLYGGLTKHYLQYFRFFGVSCPAFFPAPLSAWINPKNIFVRQRNVFYCSDDSLDVHGNLERPVVKHHSKYF